MSTVSVKEKSFEQEVMLKAHVLFLQSRSKSQRKDSEVNNNSDSVHSPSGVPSTSFQHISPRGDYTSGPSSSRSASHLTDECRTSLVSELDSEFDGGAGQDNTDCEDEQESEEENS